MAIGQSNNPDHHENHPDVIEYFLPGQLVLQLYDAADLSEVEIARAFEIFLRDPPQGIDWTGHLVPPEPKDFLKFPQLNVEKPGFSLVRVRLEERVAGKNELAGLLEQIYADLNPYRDDQKGELVPIPINPEGTLLLASVAPNWAVCGGNHVPASGGPGGWPKEGSINGNPWPQFEFPKEEANQLLAKNKGAGVHVAILDTAPCLHELAGAYNEWAGHKKGEHKLLESLLRPGGRLHVYPASYQDLLEVAEFSLEGHRYRMTDHGLFVAGILHTLAPQAQLHLYEVLNPYGVGSLESIARGFLKVIDLLKELRNREERWPLVVNCSLTLGVSIGGRANRDLVKAMRDRGLLEHTTLAFRDMVALLKQPDSVVVAAAGNDASPAAGSSGAGGRPSARFPAAFPSVIGVGALPDGSPRTGPFVPASYSNLADTPSEDGYVTLGGAGDDEKGKDDLRGLCGIFIGQYPANKNGPSVLTPGFKHDMVDYDANELGWAFWSGTSFATPVVSGLLAAWWSEDTARLSSEARPFLDTLQASKPTDKGEKVILARQV